MNQATHIAVDAMGGDFGPRVVVPAAIEALRLHPDLHIHLVGHIDQLRAWLPENTQTSLIERLILVDAAEVVSMDDKPASILRAGADTSMKRALDMLAERQVSAVVSAGNTGALVALSRHCLGMCPGIQRPAICSAFPSASNGSSYLLDMGANTDCQPGDLHQFALMGVALAKALDGVTEPRVGLLNIGVEDNKGTELVRAAAQLAAEDPRINYVGYIEGSQLLEGRVEVLVADGFSGNVALKVIEGTARYIAELLHQSLQKSFVSRIITVMFKGLFSKFWRDIDPQGYNGAFFLGVEGIVVKSHGNSSPESFLVAIEEARNCVDRDMLSLIKQELGY